MSVAQTVPTADISKNSIRKKWALAIASVVAIAMAAAIASVSVPPAADSAIAGVRTILNVPQATITNKVSACAYEDLYDDYCLIYDVTLSDNEIFQVDVNNPTQSMSVSLYDALGNQVESDSVSSGSSTWIGVAVSSKGQSTIGVEPVVRPGKYKVVLSSDYALYFSVYAFAIPDRLKLVATNKTVSSEFNDKSTRKVSGKSTQYSDGIAFNIQRNSKISIIFRKPGETSGVVTLYDSFGNKLVSESMYDGKAEITDYKATYTGLHRVFVAGQTQGRFSVRVNGIVKVKKVALNKKKVTLKLNKKKKRTFKLKATVTPKNATVRKVRWQSSNTTVVKVTKKGKLKAKRPGRAKVTAVTRDGGKRATVKVIVKKR